MVHREVVGMAKVTKYARASAQSGQSIVLIAVSMMALLAFVIFAIDGGKFYTQRRTSQNASDMASLAGMQKYYSNPAAANNQVVLKEIQRIAELNFIADPDGTAADGINANVQAWWINGAGNYVNADNTTTTGTTEPPPATALITNVTTAFKPAGATGVKVRTKIPYATFIGGLIGQPTLVAQADASAALSVSVKNFPNSNDAGWLGGSDCDNLTDRIGYNFANVNNVTFSSDLHIEGSLAVGSYNPGTTFGPDAHGAGSNVYVRTVAGSGPANGPYTQVSPYNANPLGDANHKNFSNYTGPTANYPVPGTVAASQGFSDWSYVTINNVKTQVDASMFNPTDPNAFFYKFYVDHYQDPQFSRVYFGGGAVPTPAQFFTYINGGSKAANTTGVATAISGGKHGIYYVEGDVTLSDTPSDVTVIVHGKVDTTGNGPSWGNAGVLADNISVLAGADLGMPHRCASNTADAVLNTTNSQQVGWSGIVYVPYGQAFFGGNWDNSHINGPLVAYSLNLGGGGHPDNNQNFTLNTNGYQQPDQIIQLYK